MTSSTLARLESELAEIFRNTPTGLASNAHLAIPKKPASLNAMTHGLTAQHVILTAEELPLYARMGLDYMRELQPVGVRETGNAQLMFEGRWRLHRILSIEGDLLVVSPPRPGDPVVRSRNQGPARQVTAFREEARNIELISRYETRIVRNGARFNAELKELQKDRATQNPELLFDEASNPAIDWYKRLVARSEALAKARQEYDDFEAAQPNPKKMEAGPETARAAGAAVTESPAATSTPNPFRTIPNRLTAEITPSVIAQARQPRDFTPDSIWSSRKQAA